MGGNRGIIENVYVEAEGILEEFSTPRLIGANLIVTLSCLFLNFLLFALKIQ